MAMGMADEDTGKNSSLSELYEEGRKMMFYWNPLVPLLKLCTGVWFVFGTMCPDDEPEES
jgi:hypothetical protein